MRSVTCPLSGRASPKVRRASAKVKRASAKAYTVLCRANAGLNVVVRRCCVGKAPSACPPQAAPTPVCWGAIPAAVRRLRVLSIGRRCAGQGQRQIAVTSAQSSQSGRARNFAPACAATAHVKRGANARAGLDSGHRHVARLGAAQAERRVGSVTSAHRQCTSTSFPGSRPCPSASLRGPGRTVLRRQRARARWPKCLR